MNKAKLLKTVLGALFTSVIIPMIRTAIVKKRIQKKQQVGSNIYENQIK